MPSVGPQLDASSIESQVGFAYFLIFLLFNVLLQRMLVFFFRTAQPEVNPEQEYGKSYQEWS